MGVRNILEFLSQFYLVALPVLHNIKTVRLLDPGNSNNIVSDSLDDFQKDSISDTMKWLLESIDRNDNAIETYFPANTEYPCDDAKRSAYIVSAAAKPDKLNNEDFG